jgi:hypothetical protein
MTKAFLSRMGVRSLPEHPGITRNSTRTTGPSDQAGGLTMRCQHHPATLFDKPRKGDRKAAAVAFLHSHYTSRGWVICTRCGLTGYWGGYGGRRRVRWGYGDDGILKSRAP